ncbi:MAG: PilX N-terminal domain-containing pilus assembly protein [Desulfobacterales bacterium]|nr:PilX N-terminal domain-containing pilus assembly protein [Desulfobacterales bacterium]
MKRQRVKTVKKEKGSIINVVLLILVILSLVGIVLKQTGNIDTKIATNEKLARVAYYAADAGMERAINMVTAGLDGGSPDTSWVGVSQGFGDASYQVAVEDYSYISPPAGSSSSGSSSSGSSSSGCSSLMPARGADSIWQRISGFFVSPAYAMCGSSSSGSSSSSFTLFDDNDGDLDGYIRITSTGTINNVSKSIEVILKSDGTVVSRIEQ